MEKPRELPAHTRKILDEVAACTREKVELQQKMARLRAQLRLPEEPEDEAILEAERNLSEYLQQQRQPGSRKKKNELPVALESGPAVSAVSPARADSSMNLFDYLPVVRTSTPLSCARDPDEERRRSVARRAESFSPVRVVSDISAWHTSRQCPAARARDQNHVSKAPRCECDLEILAPQVLELGKLVERREVEIRELKRAFSSKRVASPDLGALVAENERLTRRSSEHAEQAVAIRLEGASLIRVVDADQHRTQELQDERRGLLEKIGALEQNEAEARNQCEETESKIEAERQKITEREGRQEDLLAVLSERARVAERDWLLVEASTAEAQVQDICHLKEEDCQSRHAEQSAEVAEAMARLNELRNMEASLVARLAESRRRSEETEKKALGVAKELVDSSQSIAWLRAEVEARRNLSSELEEMQRRNGRLRQSLQNLQQEGIRTNASSSVSPESELAEWRTGQCRAVNEALGAAWEAEARENRIAKHKLKELEMHAQPLQQYFVRLVQALRHWRQDLFRIQQPPGIDTREQELTSLHLRLPDLEEPNWEDGDALLQVARSLYSCLEALAGESLRLLTSTEGARQRRANTESLLLQAERLALHEELERLAPQSGSSSRKCSPELGETLQQPLRAPRSSSSSQAELNEAIEHSRQCSRRSSTTSHQKGVVLAEKVPSSIPGSPQSAPSQNLLQKQPFSASASQSERSATSLSRPSVQAVSQPALNPNTWPASPVPRNRNTLSRSNSLHNGSQGSLFSSVSLHDRKVSCSSVLMALEDSHNIETDKSLPDRRVSSSSVVALEDRAPELNARPKGIVSETPDRSDPANSSATSWRLKELQRQVHELTRQSMRPSKRGNIAGPLYRVDGSLLASADVVHHTSAKRVSRTIPVHRSSSTRQIPVTHQSNVAEHLAVDDERFDDYSVHRRKRIVALV